MTQIQSLKTQLLGAIDRAEPDGKYSDSHLEALHALVQQLIALTPLPRPVDRQEYVTGAWGTRFAQFGARHTAGKPVVHETDFGLLSFGNLPRKPLRLLDIQQEIHHVSKDYNNVQIIETLDQRLRALLIVYGRYRIDQVNPQRYIVEFYKVALLGAAGENEAAIRGAFGFEPNQPLEAHFKPPRVHSDIVYCDEDMRINFGSLGGVYVLNRLRDHAGTSITFG